MIINVATSKTLPREATGPMAFIFSENGKEVASLISENASDRISVSERGAKMNTKRLAAWILVLALIVMLCSCSAESEPEAEQSGRFVYTSTDNQIQLWPTYIVTDTQTGVQYLYIYRSGGSGFTVLLDSDGKPLLDPDWSANE